jgi:hypothetical protein
MFCQMIRHEWPEIYQKGQKFGPDRSTSAACEALPG